jgi:methylmalonyl-CoA mutase cobalamin-binding domain/chain
LEYINRRTKPNRNAINNNNPQMVKQLNIPKIFYMSRKEKTTMPMDVTDELMEAVLSYNKEVLTNVVKKNLKTGMSALDIINALTLVLREVGRRFEVGDLFLAELVSAAEIVKQVVSETLEPELKKVGKARKTLGRIIIGTVRGDIHDIGKNIVASMLFSAGFEVYDLGVDVPVEKFIEEARKHNADVIAASALLTSTMPVQKELSEAIKNAGLNAKYIVGGAPVNSEWAKEIGAAYAPDAISAVKVVKQLLGVKN